VYIYKFDSYLLLQSLMLNIRVGDLVYVGGIAHQSTEHLAYSLLDTSLDLSGPI
jgi:hypothetical protein